MNTALAKHLYQWCRGFRDKRIKDLTSQAPLKIDDRTGADTSHDFCDVSVVVTGSESFRLILHNSPISVDVESLVNSRDGRFKEQPTCRQIELDLTIKDVPYIRKLAKAIKKIVGRGEGYSNKNWKWVCPRIVEALERLSFRLHSFGNIRN